MKMFHYLNEKYLVPGIAEVVKEGKTPTSDQEDRINVHKTPYEW